MPPFGNSRYVDRDIYNSKNPKYNIDGVVSLKKIQGLEILLFLLR
jgi:hypothetical protein